MFLDKDLKRSLGLKESITITVGSVIGVGLFTVGSNVVGTFGVTIFLATFIALLISIFPALLYGELGAAMPYSGGTYQYATRGLNNFWGMQAGWSVVIAVIAVASGEALAFAFYIKTLCDTIGMPLLVDDRIIAGGAIAVFIVINWCGMELSSKLQNAFLFFFWGVGLVWCIVMLPKLDFANYNSVLPILDTNGELTQFISAIALVWWCFAGFETASSIGSEIKYPHLNIPRALILSPFIVFIVTATFQWFLIGIVPTDNLQSLTHASAPYAQAMIQAGIIGFPLIMLCIGIAFGGNLSTINPTIAVPARYLYSMANDGILPKFLAKLHPKYKTPHMAVLFVGVITILLISTNSIIYVVSLSLFADLFYYIIGLVTAIALRIKFPHMPRPFKVRFAIVGAVFSIIVYIMLMLQLDKNAFFSGAIWCVVGGVIYFARTKYREKWTVPIFADVEAVPEEEKRKLDKEFRIWSTIVFSLFSFTLAVILFTIFV